MKPLGSRVDVDGAWQGATVDEDRELVFGDDGSEGADLAWLWLNEQDWPRWRIRAVTARWDPAGPVKFVSQEPQLQTWTPTWQRRDHLANDTRVDRLVIDADPRVALGGMHDADLLVVGRRRQGSSSRLGLGSTADWLLHHPPAPLAIIRTAHRVRRVLLCVDGSAHAQAAARTLAGMPWAPEVEVTVLAVSDGITQAGEAMEDAEKALTGNVSALTPCRREALRGSLFFDVRGTILEAIDSDPPDLVVMGTRGLGLGTRLLRGSTAAAVAHHAPCSALFVKGPQ